jgi:uncharacterized protein
MGHTTFQFNRRAFLRAGLSAAGALALGPSFLERAFASGPVTVGTGPYGPLQPFDENGIALPAGFRSREIARGGTLVAGSSPPYVWHGATDGEATFPTLGSGGQPDCGWILVANSEMPVPGTGGASAVEFAPDGAVERAYRILAGTTSNCAGGPTPWGTWLSCEEHDEGQVWECDPTGQGVARPRPALGVFKHEAACVDPVRRCLYLTEDVGDGCLHRFTPAVYPDLSEGLLEVASVDRSGNVTWAEAPNPRGGALDPTREQVPGATRFDGGEGIWYDDGVAYFTTKGNDRVWAYHAEPSRLEVLYDAAVVGPEAPLTGVDNITVSPSGDIYVCEDGRDHDLCLITPQFEISRFLKMDPERHAGPPEGSPIADNELVGVVFDPSGTRLHFGMQRSFGVGTDQIPRGVVYQVEGPFRGPAGGGGAPGGRGPGGGDGLGGGGQGGAAIPPAQDGAAPSLRLRVRKRMRSRRFLHEGLPISVALDEPAGVDAWLRISDRDGDGERRPATIGRAAPSVAVSGDVALRLEPTRSARRLLRGRREITARLGVVATDGAGNRTVERRTVELWRRAPGR